MIYIYSNLRGRIEKGINVIKCYKDISSLLYFSLIYIIK
jgi:hypothetical protein